MKLTMKITIWGILLLLIAGNILVFVHSLKLGDEINRFEKKISVLHQENLIYENKVYNIDSLQYAASIAARLNFTQKTQPIFLETLKYAFKP